KEAFIARLYQAPDSVRLVAAADKLHNARSILADYQVHGEDLWDRFTATKEENFWYYRTLRDAFMAVGPRTLAEALDRVVCELEEVAGMSSTAG
ncbi:MAG: phosphohydrolase, partial [Alphaproteobacteria bacterium]